MSLSPDKTTLYTLGLEGSFKKWDLNTGLESSSLSLFSSDLKIINHGFLAISEDGKTAVAAVNKESKVFKVDLVSMKIEAFYPISTIGLVAIHFIPGSKNICLVSMSEINYYDRTGKLMKTVWKGDVNEIAKGALFVSAYAISKDKKKAAVLFASLSDKKSEVKIFILPTNQVIKQTQLDNNYTNIQQIQFSADGKKLLMSGGTKILLMDVATGNIQQNPMVPANKAVFINQDQEIASIAEGGELFVLAADNLAIKSDFYDEAFLFYQGNVSCVISSGIPNGIIRGITYNQNAGSNYGAIQVISCKNGNIMQEFKGVGSVAASADFNPSSTRIACGSGDGRVRIWNLEHGGVEFQSGESAGASRYMSAAHIKNVFFDKQGQWLIWSDAISIKLSDTLLNKIIEFGESNKAILDYAHNGKNIGTDSYGGLQLWNIPSNPTETPFPSRLLQNVRNYESIHFISDNRLVACNRFEAKVFDFAMNKEIASFAATADLIYCASALADTNYLIVGGGTGKGLLQIFDLRTAQKVFDLNIHEKKITSIAISPVTHRMITASEDCTARIWEISNPVNPARLFTLRGHTDIITSCRFSKNGKFVVTTSEDKTTKIWSAETGEELCTLIGFDDDWIMITPEGYYFASKNGARLIHFSKENRLFNFDQYDLIYNRPDLVLKKIGIASPATIDIYYRAYMKRLTKLDVDPSKLNAGYGESAPEVMFVNDIESSNFTENKKYRLKIDIRDSLSSLERVAISVNGVPLLGVKGMKLEKATHKLTRDFDIVLSNGQNVIEVSATNSKGVESIRQSKIIQYIGTPAPVNLFLVAIGVSEYADTTANLLFAAKDAQDVSTLFSSNNNLFKSVKNRLMLNKNVQFANIKALKGFFRESSPDDYVILFYAGHGMQNNRKEYFVSTYDIDFDDPSQKGIPIEMLEELMEVAGSRNKIMLIDACNSGEYDQTLESALNKPADRQTGLKLRSGRHLNTVVKSNTNNSFDLMKEAFVDLRRSTGTFTIAAASGVEASLESKQWNNGVFTYSLLNGIKNMLADKNKDAQITISELLSYVQISVMDATGGIQRPASRAENTQRELRIW